MWSRIELVNEPQEIQHPAVREVLRFLGITEGVEIHHDGDLPARAGLGSSSSFTVGLLHALYGLKRVMPTKTQLAQDAILIEQDRLKENVGSQDQVIAAFGGFNKISFSSEGHFHVSPIIIQPERLVELQNHLMLFFTGFTRYSSDITGEQIRVTQQKKRELSVMQQMVDEAIGILNGRCDCVELGKLLHEGWLLKRSLTDKISSPFVDEAYEAARKTGGIGGKLLGAGGGGFLLLCVRPEDQPRVRIALEGLLHVPFRFDSHGSQIIFYGLDSAGDSG